MVAVAEKLPSGWRSNCLEALGPLADGRDCEAGELPEVRCRGSRRTHRSVVLPAVQIIFAGELRRKLNAHKLNLVDSETILKLTERVVQHAAKDGDAVIVGRGSQRFLLDRDDTLRVFLYAPREDKVRRLLARGKREEEAQVLVDSVDQERADFIRKYFHVEWPEHAVFHTLLNTSIGDQCVVQMILSLKNSLDGCAVPAAAPG